MNALGVFIQFGATSAAPDFFNFGNLQQQLLSRRCLNGCFLQELVPGPARAG
jgi:hypothetical protein